MNQPEQSQLGKNSAYVDQYDASLLFPIPRSVKREELGIQGAPLFFGADLWTAFELSWLNLKGKPQVALAHITVPAESTHIIESKSFKLYLNSFNATKFVDAQAVRDCMREDLDQALWHGGQVKSRCGVKIILPEEFDKITSILGRTPNFTELSIYSVMWSEHCSYKSSRFWLKQLPTKAPWVIHGPGENAGVIE